jgi:hypothetical protein
MADYGATDRVRSSAALRFVSPARQQRQKTCQIHSGTFAKALVADGALAPNRYPIVCNALRSRRFLEDNGLRLVEERTNAESGLSSDVTFVYALEGNVDEPDGSPSLLDSLEGLRGLLKRSYAAVGGAEKVIQAEREAWER